METQGKLDEAIKVYHLAEQTINLEEEEGLYLRFCEVRTTQYLDATIRGREALRVETAYAAKQYASCPTKKRRERGKLESFKTN